MNFNYSQEQNMIIDSVARFVQQQYSFEKRRDISLLKSGFSNENWSLFAELGWLMMPFSEEQGGLGGSATDVMLMMEEFGKGLVIEPYVANMILGGKLLTELPNSSITSSLLETLMAGEIQLALAFNEPQSRYDLANVQTIAEITECQVLLNGHKSVVLNAGQADKLLIVARESGEHNDKSGIIVVLVDANSDGVEINSYATIDGFQAAEVYLNNVSVPLENLLSMPDSTLEILEKTIDYATFSICAEAVGIMEMLYKKTVEYTKTRQQFGKPLAKFQALQHRMADMFIEYQQAKSILIMVATQLDADKGKAAQSVSAAKSRIGKAARLIGQEAVQLHGGMGVTDELDIGHYFKRLTAIQFMFGSTDFHTQRFARLAT